MTPTPKNPDAERLARELLAEAAGVSVFYLETAPGAPHVLVSAALRAIARALEQPAQEGWRPIESAPRDGTDVLTWHDYGTEVMNHRHKDFGKRGYVSIQSAFDMGHVFPSELANSGSVTFWMPLPAAPTKENSNG